MGELVIRPFTAIDESGLRQAAKVFVDSYRKELAAISRDESALGRIVADAFVKECLYAAMRDGQVVGLLGCSSADRRSLQFKQRKLQEELGWLKGKIVYGLLHREFHHPMAESGEEGYIEAVATSPAHRGRGIATALLNHCMSELPYKRYMLEVADTNAAARRIYEREGFMVFRVKRIRFFRQSLGFNARLYMKKSV